MSEWIEWEGGNCPLQYGETFEAIRRNGEVLGPWEGASDFNWGRYDKPHDTDIIRYRKIEKVVDTAE